jgi:hypothetical protein
MGRYRDTFTLPLPVLVTFAAGLNWWVNLLDLHQAELQLIIRFSIILLTITLRNDELW